MIESEILTHINLARRKKNISQKEMAVRVGISPSTYSKFESGKGSITLDRVMRVLKELELDLVWSEQDDSILKKNADILERIDELLRVNHAILSEIQEKLKKK